MRAHALHAGTGDRRRRLLSSARGRVLEMGGGEGLNLEHYPPAVTSVDVLEPHVGTRDRLLERVGRVDLPIAVHEVGVNEADTVRTGTADTVVCTFALCRVTDLAGAFAAIARTLAPDGRVLFLEHVLGAGVHAPMQRVAGAVWPRLFSGCRPDRDTVAAMRDAGFVVTDLERFQLRLAPPVVSPAVQGVARLPTRGESA